MSSKNYSEKIVVICALILALVIGITVIETILGYLK